MSDHELEFRLRELASQERTITAEILQLILIAETRGLPLQRGYPSTLDWLVAEFKYSESAAFRRIQAARLMKNAPEIKSKLASGVFNLTNLAKAQSVFKRHEKITGEKLSPDSKISVLELVENKTGHQAERILYEQMPEASHSLKADRLTALDAESSRLSVVLTADTIKKLNEIQEALGGKNANLGLGELVSHLIEKVHSQIAKKDTTSATHPSTAAVKRRNKSPRIPKSVRAEVKERAGHRCEFIDESSGRRCSSKRQLELDHIIPKFMGGTDNVQNLRLLCRSHNQWFAEKHLGKEFMKRFKNSQKGERNHSD
jgi:5-methylcytosine-specific restriction endonuclease McrA